MRIVMVSNFYNAHQHGVADWLYTQLGNDYAFVETSPMSPEQLNLGYTQYHALPYVKQLFGSEAAEKEALALIGQADILISGGYNPFAASKIKNGRPVFIFSERLFKRGTLSAFNPRRVLRYRAQAHTFNQSKNIYYLCASAYLPYDLTRLGFAHQNMFKFGYFPKLDSPLKKETGTVPRILWCGRMIGWKHGEYVLEMAKRLKQAKRSFKVTMIGSGDKRDHYKQLIKKYDLYHWVTMADPVPQEQILAHMQQSDILIQSSDLKEGWGVVTNEAMSQGCCVVASHAIGCAPYLIKHKENGLVFKSGDISALTGAVMYLLDNPEKMRELGDNAQRTINGLWSYKTAGERLLNLFDDVLSGNAPRYYDEGPCSFAQIVTDSSFNETV